MFYLIFGCSDGFWYLIVTIDLKFVQSFVVLMGGTVEEELYIVECGKTWSVFILLP